MIAIKENSGENLIFVISLPRSGSTLLQHILASHSQVGATAEPWVLFPGICALRSGVISANYNAHAGQIALSEFVNQLENKDEQYFHALRLMALDLYNAFMRENGKQRFVDKTSRYYQVLPELFKVFPKAKYIFLIRNPLAVFASFLDHMVFGNWNRLGGPGIRKDLLEGYGLIREGIRYHGDDSIVVRYEGLVSEPEITVTELCKKLGLNFEPSMLNYGEQTGVLSGRLVDPKSIHKHHSPVTDYKNAWKRRFKNPQEQHFAQAFISHLGRELIEDIGYAYSDIEVVLTSPQRIFPPLVKWDVLMKDPANRSTLQRFWLKSVSIWQKEGLLALSKHAGISMFNFVMGPARWLKRATVRGLKYLAAVQPHGIAVITLLLGKKEKNVSYISNLVSSDYELVSGQFEFSSREAEGWKEASIATQQMEAYIPLLEAMHRGIPRQDFLAAADALRLTGLVKPTILEIGCGNGYYSEILTYLTKVSPVYIGLDYSKAMLESARDRYECRSFIQGNALCVPIADNCVDIVWSGTVLMHLPDYEKAIREACRIARRFCVFHSTPVLGCGSTTFLKKKAYGTTVPEVIIARKELESLIHKQGYVIRHILESLPYRVGKVVDHPVDTLTYVCEKCL